MISYIVAILAILCFLYNYHWRVNKNSPLTNWPFLGMLPGTLWNASRIHDYVTHLLKQSGWTFELRGPWFLGFNFIITSDPANVRFIFNKNFANYIKGDDFREIYDIMGDGVFTTDGEAWKGHRVIIHSLLKQPRFTTFFLKTIQQKVENGLMLILDKFSDRGIEFDMQDIFQRFTFDNISSLVLGVDPKCLADNFPKVEFEKALHHAEAATFSRNMVPGCFWKLQRWLDVGLEKKYNRAWKIFDDFLYQTIALKRQELHEIRTQKKPDVQEASFDLLTAYIVEEMEKDRSSDHELNKSNKFLRDNAFNLMAAGRDALSASLTWFFWLVATHPMVETKIVEEIKENVKVNDDGKRMFFNIEELNKLHYLHGAVCETLRLFPPVPFLPRFSLEPEILPSGFHVSRNKRVLVSVYAMGRMESIWGKDCLEFKPERWMSERGEIVHVPSYKLMAFSTGPRSCIGKDMTLIQMKMVAATVIWNYCVGLVERHEVLPRNSVVLHMEPSLMVKISKRSLH